MEGFTVSVHIVFQKETLWFFLSMKFTFKPLNIQISGMLGHAFLLHIQNDKISKTALELRTTQRT
jgi:hypothetical protein